MKRDFETPVPAGSPRGGERKQSETDRAYSAIIDLILGHELRLGERTSVNLLSSRLGIGRTPIKEAIIRLETEGLLSVSGRSGTTVKQVSADEARQMFEVRHLIEDHCAEAAAASIRPAGIAELLSLVKTMKRCSSEPFPGSSAEFVRANASFHSGIVAAAGNPYLYRMYVHLQIPLQITSYLLYRRNDPAAVARRQAEHEAIAEALRSRNGKLLKRLLRSHTKESEQLIVGQRGASPEPTTKR